MTDRYISAKDVLGKLKAEPETSEAVAKRARQSWTAFYEAKGATHSEAERLAELAMEDRP
jgi:hypothetical protein